MSVAEIVPRGGEFERTPPHDLAAEQCVLGGMLLSKDAISDVLDVIKSHDHYRPAHQIVHEVILDLYGRGEPADPVTVAAELTKRGDIGRMGGAPYLHTLIASVPTAANAGYYARIVRERAILRRLVEVGTRIVQLGYSGDGDADELVDRAEAEVYGVTDRRVSEDYLPLAEIMPGALDEIEAIGSRGGTLTGVPTGFADLDALTNGLHPGQMVVIAARPAIGKALALDTPLPTPAGWTTMGAVQPGDYLLGQDGRPALVVAATGVLLGRPCYQVEFSDGSVLTADAGHQWLTDSRVSDRREQVVTTEQIAATLRLPGRGCSHSVANCQPLQLPAAELPLGPYTLGAWLGGGQCGDQCGERDAAPADPEVAMLAAADGLDETAPQRGQVRAIIRSLGLLTSRHIPAAYLRASAQQRRALLAGLLDAGGTVTPAGAVQFSVTSRALAADFRELAVSLGYHCGWSERPPGDCGDPSLASCTVTFTTGDDVFRLERKHIAHKERRPSGAAHRTGRRRITAVRRIPSVPVRCVQVSSPDHLYLAGRAMIPTHNSTLALDLARAAAVKAEQATVIFSLEMSRNEITMRLLSAEARVPLHAMRTGQLSDDDWTRLARRMSEVAGAPLFIDDSPNMSMMEIRAKCRRLKQRHDLRLVIVDYLQLMSSPKRVENRQQEVSELSRSLKLLAKELNVPVVALSQLNRGPEQRTDKRPLLADLRESGCLTAATRVVLADSNQEATLGELLAAGAANVRIWALDERLRLVPATMTRVFPTGHREVFRLRLGSGRQIEATASHRFLTMDGWRPLAELAAGSRIAVPRMAPRPLTPRRWPAQRLVRLARLLSGGSGRPETCVPGEMFQLPDEQVALFIRHLWPTVGSVTVSSDGQGGMISCSSASRRLIDDVAWLLRRFGVNGRITTATAGSLQPVFRLDISGREDQLIFLRDIGVSEEQSAAGARLREILQSPLSSNDIDTIPPEVWRQVREVFVKKEISRGQSAAAGGTQAGSTRPERAQGAGMLSQVAAVLDDAELDMLGTNDVCWDEIAAVESIGARDVYDATVAGLHNFVANGIAVHNSIEQDSDVVVLLHREDAYERESPRAGEADFIVAKHRNGPTATVTVAFQGHYSRFVDMAPI